MTDLAELVVRIKADASDMQREMRTATATVQASASGMRQALQGVREGFLALAPALGVAALIEFGKSAFESADRINDLALRTGFAGSSLSALSVPLKQSGSSLEEFSANINRMNNLIGEAAKGTNQEAVRAFDALGLSVKKLAALSPEEQFYAIARALSEVQNQGQQTNAGMAIFGRGFASMLPLIKESRGELRQFTEAAKASGDAISDEQLKRIDELGDNWVAAIEKMKRAILEVTPLIQTLAEVPDYLRAIFIELPQEAGRLGTQRLLGINPRVSTERPQTVDHVTFLNGAANDNPARGSNAGLLRTTAATKALSEAQREASQMFQATRTPMEVYNQNLEKAQELLDKHLIDTETYNRYLSQQSDILKNDLTGVMDDVQDKTVETVEIFENHFADAIDAATFKFRGFGKEATSILSAVAQDLYRSQLSGPISKGLGGFFGDLIGNFNFGGLFGGGKVYDAPIGPTLSGAPMGFADGGSPPVGVPSIVGERGPELFVPNTAGTVIPNHKLGGGVNVTNVINVHPGVAETVNAAILNAAPTIRDSAIEGTLAAIQRGGSAAKIVGRKN